MKHFVILSITIIFSSNICFSVDEQFASKVTNFKNPISFDNFLLGEIKGLQQSNYEIFMLCNFNKILYNQQYYYLSRDDSVLITITSAQDWDGSDWVNSWQGIYTYDAFDNQIRVINQNWNGINWINYLQKSFSYDNNDNRISLLSQTWDESIWINEWKETYSYNSYGKQINTLGKYWNGNEWVNSIKDTITYDTLGNNTGWLNKHWEETGWVNFQQYIYLYDNNGNQINWLTQHWDVDNWINDNQHLFTYDTYGNRISALSQIWSGSEWVFSSRINYTYDSIGNLITKLSQNWDGYSWINRFLLSYAYNSNGNQISKLWQTWDGTNWVNYFLVSNTYDESENQVQSLLQGWDGANWVNNRKITYTYTYESTNPTILPIANQEIYEDNSLTLELSAYSYLNTSLSFSAYSDTNAINVHVANNFIDLTPDQNWNGSSLITVIVTDENALTDTTTFTIMVLPVNDPPSEFELIYPNEEIFEITKLNILDTLKFIWQNAFDIEGDTVHYSLNFTDDLTLLDTQDAQEITDTTFCLPYLDIYYIIYNSEKVQISGTWSIQATDGSMITNATGGPISITLDISSMAIENSINIPQNFAIYPNYPNPFNPATILRYYLPKQLTVEISVYDLLGRKITTLINQTQEPGYHSIYWNGSNNEGAMVSTGVYWCVINAGEHVQTTKMVLLK